MLNIGGAELLIILLVALIFLGPERLPSVARQMGQAVSSLRSLATGFQEELEAASRPDAAVPPDEAIEPADSTMTLSGPTDQQEAIASTQTDPEALRHAARQIEYDDGEEPQRSAGGPVDLRDEEE